MLTDIQPERVSRVLQELGVAPWHMGYKLLCAAIPEYARNNTQSITKELYPFLARAMGNPNVEHSIRYAISEAWQHGEPSAWRRYFPNGSRAPSNLRFIATLAEYLR